MTSSGSTKGCVLDRPQDQGLTNGSTSTSTSLTAAALKAHDAYVSKTSGQDRRRDPIIPSGTRCLALAEEHVTDSNAMVKKHGMWAASQIKAFETAFQTHRAGA